MPETQTTNPPTFDSVRAILDRVSTKQEELVASQKETDRMMKEYRENLKETERLMKEESQRYKNEFNERLGALTNLFGDLTEAMVVPKICEKFNELGFSFLRASRNITFNDAVNKISFEVDIMLENSDKAMLIEVKTKLTLDRINYHLNRLEKMRRYADLHGDKRIFLGAVAGIVLTDETREYALSQGLYFIEYAGETFYITPPKDKPKEW